MNKQFFNGSITMLFSGKHCIKMIINIHIQGRIQEFWLGGAWNFFFKGMGSGGLKAPSGSRATPRWGPMAGAKPPETPEF